MRIRSVNIRSFGALRDRRMEFSPGMTVMHGPNESGKTTLMEFIRSVMVPSNKRNQYPERNKTDSGDLVYEQDGEVRTAKLVQKGVEGDLPRLPTGTDDPALFRSVFAMTPDDLDDAKVVTEGGIRSRFLTVPGGESMPVAMKASEDMWNRSLGKRSNSDSRVLNIQREVDELEGRIATAKASADSYGELDGRRKALQAELTELEEESAEAVKAKREADVYESNRPNYERLADLRRQRAELGEFVPVTREDVSKHDELVSSVKQKQSVLDSLTARRESEDADLMGADRRKILSYAKTIESLPGRLVSYREDARSLRDIPERVEPVPDPRPEPRPGQTRSSASPLFYLGIVLLVVGVLAALAVNTYAIALSVVGVVIAALGFRKRTASAEPAPAPVEPEHGQSPDADLIRRRMSMFEEEVSRIMADVGLPSHGIEDDVGTLSRAKEAASAATRSDTDVMRARMDLGEAKNRLMAFTQRFSGEDGFARSAELTTRSEQIDRGIRMLSEAIRSAGLDPDKPECPVVYEDGGVQDRIGAVRQEMGGIEANMKAILDTDELERMMDRRAELTAEMEDALLDGAVGLLASYIADRACDEIYSQVQPGVIQWADRYLSMMTDGRYRIDTDPRTRDLSVRSGDEVKGIGEWSSGLRAQVLLSLKLAVAREMGGGDVPVILDDVLLPFDSERKAGACRALRELSDEMQVLLFTCDRETRDICESMGVSVVRMSGGV